MTTNIEVDATPDATPDAFTTFGNKVASELRILNNTPKTSRLKRNMISRLYYFTAVKDIKSTLTVHVKQ